MIRFLFFFLVFAVNTCRAQLTINYNAYPEYLVKDILMGKNTNLKIENVKYSGLIKSIGLFSSSYTVIIPEGIILSTGNVKDAMGPNDSQNTGSEASGLGDEDIVEIAKGKVSDAAILEFDFVSFTDSISFNFFFASEEYPEYVRKGVNDVFAFFLSNEELKIKKNLAVLQSNGTPVTVDNINSWTNAEYYVANAIWDENNVLKWKDNKDLGELAYTFQFDGLTKLLHAGSKVIPNQRYHLKIVIADVGDRFYDSAVFLESGSFGSTGKVVVDYSKVAEKPLISSSDIKRLLNKDTAISMNLNIEFEFDSDEITDSASYTLLNKVYTVLENEKTVYLEIYGHTDNMGTHEYNKELSVKRARRITSYLISKGIDRRRIEFWGLGDTKPIVSNDSEEERAMNRRAEFVFKASK